MRINGIEENDQLFKEFQKKFVNGEATEEFWTWLGDNINFVNEKSSEFINDRKLDGTLNDYTILFPTNELVDN